MGHGHIVAAFKISGDAPSKGGRITQLLLIKISDAGEQIARLQLPENTPDTNTEPVLTPAVFNRLVEFVAASSVVTHDGYSWKRFLRQEFASQPKAQLKEMLARTIDVSQWSQQRFPRQRKDVGSLCARLKIKLPSGLQGLEREAVAIRLISTHIHLGAVRQEEVARVVARAPLHEKISPMPKPTPASLPFRMRLRQAWKILIGTDS
jgi:hypothetical protein